MAQLINTNFLSQVGFQFGIKKLPTANFFVQSVNLPGIEMANAVQPTPFIAVPVPGDHIKFNDLTVTFKVDEDLRNYLEIYNWIIGLGFPDNFDQYRTLATKPVTTGEGIRSDASLIITTSSRVPATEVVFVDLFPRSLTDIIFDSTDTNIEYISATATFKYRRHYIKRLT